MARYNRTAEEKKKLADAFAGYVPGGYRASTEMPKRKKKKKAVKKKAAKKGIAGQAWGRDADATLRRIKAGN
jgi:hypothetical protein